MSGVERSDGRQVPRRLIMIGYDPVEKLISDGKIRLDDVKTLELQFNFGKMFDDVLYIVPFGRKTQERRLSDTILYRELEFERPGRGMKMALGGLKHVISARMFLDRAVDEFHPDVVQTVGPHITAAMALIAPKVRALPTICFIEAYWETILPWQTYFPRAVRKVLPLWYRLVYRLFDRYTGAPSLSLPYYTSRGMSAKRIAPWIQPLDLSEVNEAKIDDAPYAVRNAANPRIVVLGRLHPEKLAPDALEIFAGAVKDDQKGTLIFVGDGADRTVIEKRAAELGLRDRIVITGQVSHRVAMSVLKACDMSIAPMQGSALLETLAAGLPTVAYDHETHAALIETGVNGILVPHRDTKAAATALRNWLISPDKAQKIGLAAQSKVADKYNVSAMRSLLLAPFIDAFNSPKFVKRRAQEAKQ